MTAAPKRSRAPTTKAYAQELVLAAARVAGSGGGLDGIEAGRGHRREDGETKRPTDLLTGVEQGRRHPGVLPGDTGDRRRRDAHEGRTHACADRAASVSSGTLRLRG
jgi:hypothetical protein